MALEVTLNETQKPLAMKIKTDILHYIKITNSPEDPLKNVKAQNR